MELIQINLQPHFGGGEIYTKFVCRALERLGASITLVHHHRARYWDYIGLPASVKRVPVAGIDQVAACLPAQRSWVLSHGPLAEPFAADIAAGHLLTAIAHMPPQGRPQDRYSNCRLVFGVSRYVVDGLRRIGVPTWPEPLYGVADLQRAADTAAIRQTSCYDWDRRKGRDRLLSWLEPLAEPLRRRPMFLRRPGVTLGIVSRLTPIKQFPQLLEIIAPGIAQAGEVTLDIFGAGGYASVRDLRRAVAPLGERARFWGHQSNVVAVYRQIDYLLTGLPEKEALGLNVIEAQACGTPVLAVDAPPFNETVLDGYTGFLYADPRHDGGGDFTRVLTRALVHPLHITNDELTTRHLERFSEAAFMERIAAVKSHVESNL